MQDGGYDDQGEIAGGDPKAVPHQERFHPRRGGSDQEGERVGRRVSLSVRDKGLRFCAPGVDVRDSWLIERLLYVITADKTRLRYRKVSPTFFQCLTFPSPQLTSILLNLSIRTPTDLDMTPNSLLHSHSLCSRMISCSRPMERSGRIPPAGCDSVGLDRDRRDVTCLFRDFGQLSVFLYDQIKLCKR